MSMIEIQATRSQKSNDVLQGREKYQLSNASSNTGTPIYVGSMILALAMYLKSVVVSPATPSSPPLDTKDEANQTPNPHLVGISTGQNRSGSREVEPDEGEKFEHGSNVKTFSTRFASSLDYFRDYGPTRVHYVEPPKQKFMTTGEPVSFSVLPSNDNLTSNVNSNISGSSSAPTAKGDSSAGEEDGETDDDDAPSSNRRPVVAKPVVLYDQFACMAVMIALADLLRGASDPDGDLLQVRNATASSGELRLTDGGYQYHSEKAGNVTITYKISDGQFEVLQTATFNVLEKPPIIGTTGDDNLLGTECEDRIFGDAGNDQIDGRAGDDEIVGGDGNDHIVGGDGDDVMFGNEGDDIIFGGLGNDTLFGGEGEDRLFGGAGNDLIRGGLGNDRLAGDSGNDVLLGGSGNDLILDGDGSDHVDGETGDDIFVAATDAADDLFNGGTGTDRIDYSASKTSLTFDLSTNTVAGADIGLDQIANIEIFVGGEANDVFSAVRAIEGMGAMESPQHFIGGAGVDSLDYSRAQTALTIDIVNGQAVGATTGTDIFLEIEHFIGGDGNDNFIVGQGSITLDGRAGNDMFEFLNIGSTVAGSISAHHIIGFEQGDWVRMSKYDIFERAIDTLEEAFGEVYGDSSENALNNQAQDNVIPIRVRHEVSDTIEKTYIDADFDRDSIYEISVQLDGSHNLLITNGHLA
jgi:Ca2+-binding RTX toxin-like protein